MEKLKRNWKNCKPFSARKRKSLVLITQSTLWYLEKIKVFTKARRGAVVLWLRLKTKVWEDLGSNPDTAKETILYIPFIWIKAWIKYLLETLTWHCCMFCNPANGRVDIEKLLAYKIQLHGLE